MTKRDCTTDPMVDCYGKPLHDGLIVEIDTAEDDGSLRLGQIIGNEPDSKGNWKYRYINYNGNKFGDYAVGYAANFEIGHVRHEPKQTDASRATRRRLRSMGWRIKNSWGDGLVQMKREEDDCTITVRLDGSIRVSSISVFRLTCDLIQEGGFKFADSKGYNS